MSSRIGDLDINTVLEDSEINRLGEPVDIDETTSTETAINVEFREYRNPETEAFTSPAFNIANQLSSSFDLSSSKSLEDEIDQALDKFAQEFGGYHENAVYVGNDLWNLVDEDSIAAFMKFKGIEPAYPVKIRSKEDFQNAVEETEYGFTEGYLNNIEDRFTRNNFVVPALYTDSGLPKKIPATMVYRPEDGITAFPEDPMVNEGVDDFNRGKAGFSDHPHIEEWHIDGGYELTIDCISAGISSPKVEISENEFVVYDGGEEVYRANPSGIRLDETLEEETERTFKNGVYNLRI